MIWTWFDWNMPSSHEIGTPLVCGLWMPCHRGAMTQHQKDFPSRHPQEAGVASKGRVTWLVGVVVAPSLLCFFLQANLDGTGTFVVVVVLSTPFCDCLNANNMRWRHTKKKTKRDLRHLHASCLLRKKWMEKECSFGWNHCCGGTLSHTTVRTRYHYLVRTIRYEVWSTGTGIMVLLPQ